MTEDAEEFAGQFRQVLGLAARHFARHDSAIARSAARALADLAGQAGVCPDPAARPHPACARIAAMLDQPSDVLLAPLACCCGGLHWRSPGFGRLPENVAGAMAVCELMGPDGMVAHENLRIGLLYQGPGHHYPDHSHAAEELYVVLCGSAFWGRAGVQPVRRGAGNFIHHAPWESHSMRTRAAPLLALWAWAGDITAGTYSLRG